MSEGPGAAPPFDAVGLARDLLRSTRTGALATLGGDGAPFASLVTVATDIDGSPLLLVSGLSGHTRNLDADPRASLLLSRAGRGDPLAHPRLTVSGRVEPVGGDDLPRGRRRFLARHPKAALYADFPDFSLRRLVVAAAHLNGGFARAAVLAGRDVLSDPAAAAALAAGEEGAVAHMNADHRDALRAYAVGLCGGPDGEWLATGLDPDGIDLARGDAALRLAFPRPVATPGDLRAVLVDLAGEARRRLGALAGPQPAGQDPAGPQPAGQDPAGARSAGPVPSGPTGDAA